MGVSEQDTRATKLTSAQARRLAMLASCAPEKVMAFDGHGFAACLRLADLGYAEFVGQHGLGGAFRITPLGREHLERESG
jgi:hypothetical protein